MVPSVCVSLEFNDTEFFQLRIYCSDMPRTKCVQSLKVACLSNICRHMENVWCKDYDINLSELPRLLYVIGPFEDITSHDLEDLFKRLIELKLLRRKHFPLLMTSHLKELNLSICKSVGGTDGILSSAARRCKKLRNLNLCGCKTISPTVLKSAFQQLPLLTSLNIGDTKCNDSVVSVIGSSCPNLLDLNLQSCHVSDKSVYSLCPYSFKHAVPSKQTNTGCHKLTRLVIDFTKISCDGAKYLLENMKNLHYLGYTYLFDVLLMCCNDGQTISSSTSQKCSSKLRLRSMSFGDINGVSDEEIVCVMDFMKYSCPFLTEFHFHGGATDRTLVLLKDFDYLSVLELDGSHEQITFQYGVVPLLQFIGAQIKSLSLFEFDNIDVMMIGILCENIRNLRISVLDVKETTKYQTRYLPKDQTSNHKIFFCLEKFTFTHISDHHTFSEISLLQVLENTLNLQELDLSFTPCFSDHLFENLLQENKLTNLKKLHLVNCDNITCCSIDNLVYSNNSLRDLILHDCANISLRDFERYKKFVKYGNMDLHVQWN